MTMATSIQSIFKCCADNQQSREIDNKFAPVKVAIVSRRLVMELVGFNSVLMHVCPAAHGAPQVMGYSGATGPDKWGRINSSYSACSYGNAQSPIEIAEKDIVSDRSLGPLNIEYNDASATLINNGYNVEVCFTDEVGGSIIDGEMYYLKQMHWHSPSEHTIDGVRYSAELHLVHTSANGRISVVAILYKFGTPDPLLSQIGDQFDQLGKKPFSGQERAHIPIELVRTKEILQSTNKYFRYEGSLTTPPCSEKVMWNILKEVREISKEQVACLKAPLDGLSKNNSRPIQPLNGRHIKISTAS